MKKHIVYTIIAIFVLGCSFSACSKSGEGEKGFVEKTNKEMGKAAVDYVNKPISKAKQVRDMANTKEKKLEETEEASEE